MLRTFVARILAVLVMPLCMLAAWITDRTQTYPENVVLPVSSQNFGAFEAIRFQGVTTDGESWYYSWNLGLIKTDMCNNITAINFIATPMKYLVKGLNHIGGISYWDGKLYCPIEDNANFRDPTILVFDAKTLNFTGEAYAVDWELHQDGVPWVAADGPRGCAYTANWENAAVLNVLSLEDFSVLRTLPLSSAIDRVQGGEVWGIPSTAPRITTAANPFWPST